MGDEERQVGGCWGYRCIVWMQAEGALDIDRRRGAPDGKVRRARIWDAAARAGVGIDVH